MKRTPRAPDQHATGYWWFVMAVMGTLSLVFNLWMVVAPPPGVSAGKAAANLVLGIIVHASPVLLSAIMSHGFKTPLLGEIERKIIIVLFLGFMGMSVSHQAELLTAYIHWTWAWFMPIAIDTIALLALRAILNAHRLNKEAKQARDIAAERAAVARDIRPDVELEIQRQYEEKMPAVRRDITAAVWRDIWAAVGGDIPADIGGDIERNLPALVEYVQGDILRQQEGEFADRDRDMATKWAVERIDFEDKIRQEEQEAALERWVEQEAELASQIEFRLRKELRPGSGSGAKRRAITAESATPKVTMEKGLEIVRQAILDGEEYTNVELAEMIGRDTKTVIRYKKKIKAEMDGIAVGDTADNDDAGQGQTPGHGRLRAV